MSADGAVHVELKDGCAWVTLDRPALNLLTPEFNRTIAETFTTLSGNGPLRAAVITGAGRHFSGGMQIEAMRDLSSMAAKALISGLCEAISAVHNAPFVTVAMVNGACLGAGFELAMACDLRILADDARLGLPEVRVGIPSVIHAALLPSLVGQGRAAELLLLGQSVSAAQALAWGLANRVVAASELGRETESLVADLLLCGPEALRLQKELMIRWRGRDLGTALRESIEVFTRAFATDEPREAMTAYLEKRDPHVPPRA